MGNEPVARQSPRGKEKEWNVRGSKGLRAPAGLFWGVCLNKLISLIVIEIPSRILPRYGHGSSDRLSIDKAYLNQRARNLLISVITDQPEMGEMGEMGWEISKQIFCPLSTRSRQGYGQRGKNE